MYRVVREYSHTDKRCLHSVESRLFQRMVDAIFFKNFLKEEWAREHPKNPTKFFVIEEIDREA